MSFKVIDGDGPGSEERRRQWQHEVAENQFSWAIREAGANMLRIARGAGSPGDLLPQLDKVMSTALAFYQLSGRWPIDVIEKVIPLQSADEGFQTGLREGRYTQADIERWSDDGTIGRLRAEHTIVRGALQVAASELVQQRTQRKMGHRELHNGVDQLERSRRRSAPKVNKSDRRKKTRPSWDDVVDDL